MLRFLSWAVCFVLLLTTVGYFRSWFQIEKFSTDEKNKVNISVSFDRTRLSEDACSVKEKAIILGVKAEEAIEEIRQNRENKESEEFVESSKLPISSHK